MIRRRCTRPSQNGCDQFVYEYEHHNIPANETQISLQVQEYFHQRAVKAENYNTFIVTARDPVYRVISWYLHSHPLNDNVGFKAKKGVKSCEPAHQMQ